MQKCVPVPHEKNILIKTTKAIPCKKKVPIERIKWEKKCVDCTKIVEKKVLVPCTKTITIPSTKIVTKKVEVPDQKIEWVCKKYIDYEEVDDYKEVECEEKIKVPTWKMDERNVEVCQHEVNWVSKEVPYDHRVEVCRPFQKVYKATVPVKKFVQTHEIESQEKISGYDCDIGSCARFEHTQVCGAPCECHQNGHQEVIAQGHIGHHVEHQTIVQQQVHHQHHHIEEIPAKVIRQDYIVKQKSSKSSKNASPLTKIIDRKGANSVKSQGTQSIKSLEPQQQQQSSMNKQQSSSKIDVIIHHKDAVPCEKTSNWQETKQELNQKNHPGVMGYKTQGQVQNQTQTQEKQEESSKSILV